MDLCLTDKNLDITGPVFPQIYRSRFTMAVDYSWILKELQGDGWVRFLGGGGVGWLIVGRGEGLGRPGWKKSPDFRPPEVGTSAT